MTTRVSQVIGIDISPLSNPSVGIGRSVSGLMRALPDISQTADIVVVPYFRKALGSLSQYGLADFRLTRLRAPIVAEAWVRRLGLIELLSVFVPRNEFLLAAEEEFARDINSA